MLYSVSKSLSTNHLILMNSIVNMKIPALKSKIAALYNRHEIIKNFSAIFSVDVLIKATNLALIPVFLKLMSQTEFGLYNYIISIISLFTPLLGFGLHVSQSKIYNGSDSKLEKQTYLFTENVLLLALLSISLPLIYFFKLDLLCAKLLFKQNIDFTKYRLYISLAIVSGIYFSMLFNFFMNSSAIKRTQAFNLLRMFAITLVPLFTLLIIHQDVVLVRLRITYLLDIAVCAAFYYFYYKEMVFVFDAKLAFRSLKIGIPYVLSTLPGTIIVFLDKYFLEKTSYVDLSVYYLAVTLGNIIPTIFYSLQNVWMPIFFREKNLLVNIKRTTRLLKNILLCFAGFSILILIGTKGLLFWGLIGKNYNGVIPILPLLLAGQLLSIVSMIYSSFVIYVEKTYLFIVVNILILIPSFVLNHYLIPIYGPMGAAWAFVLINLFCTALYLIIMLKIYIIAKKQELEC